MKAGIFTVRRFSRFAAAEMARRCRLAIALMSEQLNEPWLVLDLFVQNARGQVIGAWIFAKGYIAHGTPASDRTPLRFKQQGENVDRCRWVWQFGRTTTGLIMKFLEIVRKLTAKFINARNDQLPMSPVFESRVFADLLVVLVSGKVHAQDRVVVVCAGELRRGVGDQHLDKLLHIHAASADDLNANPLRYVARLHCLLRSHRMSFL